MKGVAVDGPAAGRVLDCPGPYVAWMPEGPDRLVPILYHSAKLSILGRVIPVWHTGTDLDWEAAAAVLLTDQARGVSW